MLCQPKRSRCPAGLLRGCHISCRGSSGRLSSRSVHLCPLDNSLASFPPSHCVLTLGLLEAEVGDGDVGVVNEHHAVLGVAPAQRLLLGQAGALQLGLGANPGPLMPCPACLP